MFSEPVCSLCCRRGGGCGGGAPINGLGCTGACLRWAVSNIKHPPFFEHGTPWQAWQLTTTIVACFRAICSDLNDLGCGCLHWSVVITPRDCSSMWAACWIALARERYFTFLTTISPDSVRLWCPDLPAFYETLCCLHENCSRLPTVVYTLFCDAAEDDALQVRILALNGEIVDDVRTPLCVTLSAWRHIPPSCHRTSVNGNHYTLPSYLESEEHLASSHIWARLPPCYEHRIAFVDVKAVSTSLCCEDALALWTFY